MRILGLDIGSRRIGVAVSDPAGRVATPLTVLDAKALSRDIKPLARLVEDYEVGRIVVGLPLSLDGTEGPQARDVRATAKGLMQHVGVPLTYHDERLSSAEARRAMAAAGSSGRQQRGSVDKVAATVLLQSWLDMQARAEVETDIADE